ncbi:transposase family protein [Streptomyces mirabilis]
MELQRERTLRARRGHERLVAPGTGAKATLTPANRILVTVLHLRKFATMDLLGQLFGVTAMTISRASQEVQPLLNEDRRDELIICGPLGHRPAGARSTDGSTEPGQ